MKYPTRLSDAVHILAFIALYPDCDLTSNKLAESIQTNPAYVRQLMSALRKGGLLVSVKGHPRPALAREPEYFGKEEGEVTVGEILLSKLKIREKEHFIDDNGKK